MTFKGTWWHSWAINLIFWWSPQVVWAQQQYLKRTARRTFSVFGTFLRLDLGDYLFILRLVLGANNFTLNSNVQATAKNRRREHVTRRPNKLVSQDSAITHRAWLILTTPTYPLNDHYACSDQPRSGGNPMVPLPLPHTHHYLSFTYTHTHTHARTHTCTQN